MLLLRWCLALLFCASVSVAWGQVKIPKVPEPSVAPVGSEDPFNRAPPPAKPSLDVVVIEVTIAKWHAKPAKDGEEQSAPSLEDIDLAALEKSGQLRVKERIRLTTLDQMKASFQRGENVPVITGVSSGGRGGGTFGPQRSVNYQQVGTMLTITPRIAEGRILVEVKIDRSSLDDIRGPLLAKGEDGEESRAASILSGSTQSTVSLVPGKPLVIGGMTRHGNDSSDGEVIMISAEVLK